ncbi:hypothetical protein AB7M49_006607 [Bradyrhizobium elkanii]
MSTTTGRHIERPPALDDEQRGHLIKLLGMLGTSHDGERAAAGLKAHQFLIRLGLSWRDVIGAPSLVPAGEPEVSWIEMVDGCLAAGDWLTEKEADFVNSLRRWRRKPTPRQMEWLVAIFERVAS